jgi:hypothetical protein
MTKIVLDDIAGGYNLSVINDNFQKIEDEFNNKVLYRNNPVGEPNSLQTNVDVNGKVIYNLPVPTLNSQAARLKDVQNAISGGNAANLIEFNPYLDIVSTNVQGAIQEVKDDVISSESDLSQDLLDYKNDVLAPTGTSLVGYTRADTGAVSTSLTNKLRWQEINLFDFLSSAQIATAVSGVAADLTSQIQAAINASVGKRLVINAGKFGLSYVGWGTNGVALDIPSNITIEFEQGASFESMAHNATIYQMIRIWDRENVTIIRPTLNGRKDLNAAVTGEFGMGIDIRGSVNVHIISPRTDNMWGDGIYIGETVGTGAPVDIMIDRHSADGCRRQGMSIVSGAKVTVNDPVWSTIGPVAPSAGLDIEPNSNSDELHGIVINNPKTVNCTTGIQIQLANLAGVSRKIVDIQIHGHIDDGSTVAFSANGANTSNNTFTLCGRIVSDNAVWADNDNSAFLMSEYDAFGPDVFLIRPTVIDCNRSGQASPKYGAPFSLLRDTGSILTYAMGGLHIEEPSVILTSGSVPRLFSFQDVVNGITKVVDCHFIDPVNLKNISDVRGNFQGTGSIADRFSVWNYNIAGTGTLDFNFASTVVSPNASTVLTLSTTTSFIAGSPDVMIRNGGAASCIIATAAGGNLVGSAVGIRLQSPAGNAGSYVRLRPLGADIWLVMEKYGTWNLI